MRITVIGAGNSGISMAAHLSKEGNQVTLWNRSRATISKLIKTHSIYCEGTINGIIKIYAVTDSMDEALENPDIILITTPANSHKELAELIAKKIKKSTVIVLNPGRTFGALEFKNTFEKYNSEYKQIIAETQTIIYTCRKTAEDAVNIIALKDSVLISALNLESSECIISYLPDCIKKYFKSSDSMIQTSIGNVGMILHCAPLLLNAGWTESLSNTYKYYYDGITPTIGELIEKIDMERVEVSVKMGYRVESAKEWLIRTYHVIGQNIYDCIQNNKAYKNIEAPSSLKHRYIFEDIPCGLVPLEAIGQKIGVNMEYTTLIIDLASKLMDVDFRKSGRNLRDLNYSLLNV
ncbi:NAD/NADP-dependent octopine/nopaline dehydrogenase family protein [Eubacterium sp. 1001713B170207_170306_E7]|uniref:NAD/NADP-dependent octopine/nopaline dehydrogenase family protein n=1 Tax=Eubacterium sp. 1001713B170207_170306_E7 TaxID=2787097 RepID=UPI001899D766|nr:NAD/NADP-dependent octopine/nopaline dehydrogenase family protein [Eubacterium sp. 1001713B170207_170306_E7]